MINIIVTVYNREEFILRALESIPKRDDIKIIIVDDCSTDNSLNIVKDGISKNNFETVLLENDINLGVGASKERAYKLATDDFIYVLDSDDYILTDRFSNLLDNLNNYNGYDIIRVKVELNNGLVDKKSHTSGGSYILRNRFNIEYPKMRKAEDGYYGLELCKQGAKIIDTNLVVYHYNYPHKGSLVGNYEHGLIDGKGDKI